ncbi:MAG TPA: SpoIIE family protein phosphatase [Bryobacteraceae bacterium]|nr:SpoIIE family protein phosphatase [Bryobacteraceae bacterium]
MPAAFSKGHGRPYVVYFCLLLLFAIAVTYHARTAAGALGVLLQSNEHVRDPFEIDGPEMVLTHVQPEARAAGVKDGDLLIGIRGQSVRGFTDFYSVLRQARPGQRLEIQVRLSTPGSGGAKDASIDLQPAFPSGPQASDWLSFTIETLAIPVLCFALGFWVTVVRIRDKLAWLLLVLLLSFAEMFGAGGYPELFGRTDLFHPVFVAYHILFANLFSSALLLFALYFPEQLSVDRKFAWAKWLVIGPLLFEVVTDSITVSLYLHHAGTAREFQSNLGSIVGAVSLLHLLAIALFFGILGYKTFTASGRDARRRLLLIDTASAVSVTPIILWLFFLRAHFVFPEWGMLLMAALWFLFPLTMAYVILVYRAMDVRLVIRQGLRYLLATSGVRAVQATVSLVIILIAANMSGDQAGTVTRRMVAICVGFALIVLIGMFAGRVQRWLDRRFFREAFNAEQILSELGSQVRRIVDTGSVLKTVAHRISESLHVPRVALLLNNGGIFELAYAVGCSGSAGVGLSEDSLTVQHLKENQQLTVRFDEKDSWIRYAGEAERDSIEKLKPELLLPLSLNEKLVGIMSLGPKQSEEPFTRTDIQLLDSVATQTGLALENSRLTAEIAAELAARERMNRELEIAREVQERLFPQKTPSIPGIEIAGYCRPALGVGGDYYDYFALADGNLGIAIGDVSGKGFPAALLMASLRASLRAQTMRGECDLAAIMQNVNTLGYESSAVNKYATFFYGQFSPGSRLLRYVNAGHEPPLIFRGDSVIRLDIGGPVVGLLPCVHYDKGTLTLEPGDILVALTDGISEAMNPSDEEWGVENLISCVRDCGILKCGSVIERAIASADAFAAGAKQHDDMTLIVARILDC